MNLPVLQSPIMDLSRQRKPPWLKVRLPGGGDSPKLHKLFTSLKLHTVCEEAHCPNQAECWAHGTATFMILGDICTRSCGFCAVKTGRPLDLDWDEPRRVAEAVAAINLQYVVITSVNRDEVEHGGAPIFAETVRQIREMSPGIQIELLIPDLKGNWDALKTIIESGPDILNHNLETVPRLYPWMRPQAKFERSLELLRRSKLFDDSMPTKSGVMVGAGEDWDELLEAMQQIADTGCDILTIGQYLRPSQRHHPVYRYYRPDEFEKLRDLGHEMGFGHVESGPLVRSSYHAWDQTQSLESSRK